MDRKKFKNRFIKVTNINEPNSLRFKTRYNFGGIKFTVKNNAKLLYYKKQRERLIEQKYNDKIEKINSYKSYESCAVALLNIFVVTYNHEKTIARCLDSILAQKTSYPYIITILDDNSRDNTFNICLEYLQQYSNKIRILTQKNNTNGKHISAAFRKIDTEYYSFIDGDDYWCNENKVQKSISYLEEHKDIIMYVHDVGLEYKSVIKSLTHDINNVNITENPFDIYHIIDSHLSGRIYRNIIDFKKEFINVRKRDGVLNEIFLSKGKAYFDDEIMSIYDQTSGGVWNCLSRNQRNYSRIYRCYNSNKILNFKYDNVFIKNYELKKLKKLKLIFGKRLAWRIYIFIKRFSYEFNEIKLLHKRFNNIERGHNDFTQKDMDIIYKICEEWK